MRYNLLLVVAILIAPKSSIGQPQLFFDSTIPVHHDGNSLDLAWAGGANFVQLSAIDLDGDGLKDLFLFDRTGNKVITLLNTGTGGTGAYRITRDYDHVYPFNALHDWALLRDFNCDGKMDIFSYSQAGFSVYRNTSEGNSLSFELETFRVNSNYVTTGGNPVIANLFVSLVDMPGIVDVDGDGDLDILTFSLLGTYVEYHKNLSMESYGHCDSLIYEVRNRCWGSFSENFSDNSVTLNNPCSFNVPNPEMPQEPGRPEFVEFEEADRAHAGSALTPLDLNGDGVMDLLLGDISFHNVVGLYNGGTVDLGLMTQVDSMFPGYDTPVDLPFFPGSHYQDIDNDGLRDLVVSSNSGSLAHNFKSIWYYRNIGTDASPVFDFQQDDLFQDRMLEFGEGAYPVPFDHNGDGLMDLVVANHGYYQSDNTYQGRLALLLNVGTATHPAFELVTDDYMSLSSTGIGTAMYPAFGDVDGDGDLDMYIGDLQGRIHFFRNISGGGPAQFQLIQANVPDADGVALDVGQFATPQFVDLDGDGLLDLIIGERNGNLNYYRNTGSATVAQWTLMSEELGGVSTVEWWNVTGYSVPFLYENELGDTQMLLGSESGWLYHYGDIEGNISGQWTLLDSMYLDIYDGHRTAPCMYDFTGDGVPDLVLGNYRGGLSFWRSDDVTTTNDIANTIRPFKIVPNPASDMVQFELPYPQPGHWIIRNGMGQEIMRVAARQTTTTVSLSGLAPGVYHVQFDGPGPKTTQQLVVIGASR